MKRPLLPLALIATLLPATVNADVVDDYLNTRADFMMTADSCDMINARDILQLGTLSVAELRAPELPISDLFRQTRDLRAECYQQAADKLTDMINAAVLWAEQKPNDLTAQRQLEIDQDLSELLRIRSQISLQLLTSMEDDVQETVKKTPRRRAENTFVEESAKTRGLIQQDMAIVLEIERRQIAADEAALAATAKPEMADVARVKLMKATHHISQALLVFENALTEPRAYHLARLMSEFSYGSNQFAELFAMHPILKGIDEALARQIAGVADRALVLQMDLEGAVRELRNNDFRDDYEQWLSEIYQDMSQIAVEIRTLYHHLPKTPALSEGVGTPKTRAVKSVPKTITRAAPRTAAARRAAATPLKTGSGETVPAGEAPVRLLEPKAD